MNGGLQLGAGPLEGGAGDPAWGGALAGRGEAVACLGAWEGARGAAEAVDRGAGSALAVTLLDAAGGGEDATGAAALAVGDAEAML